MSRFPSSRHTSLPRAAASAQRLGRHLSGVPVIEAPELVDHVPYVPSPDETPLTWAGFFDGYDDVQAEAGQEQAASLVARFGGLSTDAREPSDTHEILITHAYPIAWLLWHALDAPPARWLGLDSANAALTLIEHRSGLPPTVVMINEMSHLPADLRWTGFPGAARP